MSSASQTQQHQQPLEKPSSSSKKQSKNAKELEKRYAKQAQRKIKSGQLPDPSLDIPIESYVSFSNHLRSSKRILALLGAGLSASSGIPTFRGRGGFWRGYDATTLATPEAFFRDPSLVWQFYEDRRCLALRAQPNRGHLALAELARRRPGDFLAITQNIDGLEERAGQAAESLQQIHGTLHAMHCSGRECGYRQALGGDEHEPPAPSLRVDDELRDADPSDARLALKHIEPAELPHCPRCGALLRPSVVWFGEPTAEGARERIHAWLDEAPKVDLMLVVGTTAVVFPAAAYIHAARVAGARIAVFNLDPPTDEDQDDPVTRLRDCDWHFRGNAADILPEVLKETIGKIPDLKADNARDRGPTPLEAAN